MSDDSSNTKTDSPEPAKRSWGIIAGTIVPILALFGPLYILAPFFIQFVLPLKLADNVESSLEAVSIAVVSGAILAAALAVYGKKFNDLGINRPKITYIGKAFAGFLVYFAITYVLQFVYQFVLHQPDTPQNIGYSAHLSGLELLFAGLTIVLIVPLKEELIFRGFMFKGFRSRVPFWPAAFAVSAVFGLVHGQWNVGLDVFAMSLVSCYLVEHTKSLWPSIFLHMIKNGVAFYLLYLYNGG